MFLAGSATDCENSYDWLSRGRVAVLGTLAIEHWDCQYFYEC